MTGQEQVVVLHGLFAPQSHFQLLSRIGRTYHVRNGCCGICARNKDLSLFLLF